MICRIPKPVLNNFCSIVYRSTLWNDHPEALRNIALTAKDLPKSLDVSSFVEKSGETKKDILRAYVKGI